MSNINSRSMVAKLLAQENITVGVVNAPTAFFDLNKRFLGLPNFENTTPTIYNMLVAHEIGHALFTPTDEWNRLVKAYPMFKDYLNVIEDIRIERLVIEKYPGLTRDFIQGYRELGLDRDFFGVANTNTDNMAFINRINIHYKMRGAMNQKFKDGEQAIIDRINSMETWEDVVSIAMDTYKSKQNPNYNPSSDKSNYHDLEEFFEDLEIDVPKIPNEGGINYGSDINLESDSDDGDMNSNVGAGGSNTDKKLSGSDESELDDDIISVQAKFENNIRKEFVVEMDKVYNVASGRIIPASYMDNKVSLNIVNKTKAEITPYQRRTVKEIESSISHLIQEFNMRKSATSYSRARISNSGEINMNKLYDYKTNEDIFLKVLNVQKGKSHGVYILLDYSSSMDNVIKNVWKQIYILAEFCKKVNIPFKVVSFTSGRCIDMGEYLHIENVFRPVLDVKMREIISSTMTKKEYEIAKDAILYRGILGKGRFNQDILDGMGGTPLYEAYMGIADDVLEFKATNKTEIMNLIVMTDGDGTPLFENNKRVKFIGKFGSFDIQTNYSTISCNNMMAEISNIYRKNGVKINHFHISNIWYIKSMLEFQSVSDEEFKEKYAAKILRNGFYASTQPPKNGIYDKAFVLIMNNKIPVDMWKLSSYEDEEEEEEREDINFYPTAFMKKVYGNKQSKTIAAEIANMVL